MNANVTSVTGHQKYPLGRSVVRLEKRGTRKIGKTQIFILNTFATEVTDTTEGQPLVSFVCGRLLKIKLWYELIFLFFVFVCLGCVFTEIAAWSRSEGRLKYIFHCHNFSPFEEHQAFESMSLHQLSNILLLHIALLLHWQSNRKKYSCVVFILPHPPPTPWLVNYYHHQVKSIRKPLQ